MNISHNISKFIGTGQRSATGRDASFDFCFNYFQSFRRKNDIESIASSKNIEFSCLQLGFYLASWGMLRGRSPLGQKWSSKHYQRFIENLVRFDPAIWDIDIPDYGVAANVSLLLEFGSTVTALLQHDSSILKTKVMLGIFGNVPAFDQFFCLRGYGLGGNATFCKKNLKAILDFYNADKSEMIAIRFPRWTF